MKQDIQFKDMVITLLLSNSFRLEIFGYRVD